MSSVIRDVGEQHRITGEFLNDLLYEDGKPIIKKGKVGIKKELSYEELWNALEAIRVESWSSYNAIKESFGW